MIDESPPCDHCDKCLFGGDQFVIARGMTPQIHKNLLNDILKLRSISDLRAGDRPHESTESS